MRKRDPGLNANWGTILPPCNDCYGWLEKEVKKHIADGK